jgi:hypothetical protein
LLFERLIQIELGFPNSSKQAELSLRTSPWRTVILRFETLRKRIFFVTAPAVDFPITHAP